MCRTVYTVTARQANRAWRRKLGGLGAAPELPANLENASCPRIVLSQVGPVGCLLV
jgi:hypothetical protein